MGSDRALSEVIRQTETANPLAFVAVRGLSTPLGIGLYVSRLWLDSVSILTSTITPCGLPCRTEQERERVRVRIRFRLRLRLRSLRIYRDNSPFCNRLYQKISNCRKPDDPWRETDSQVAGIRHHRRETDTIGKPTPSTDIRQAGAGNPPG